MTRRRLDLEGVLLLRILVVAVLVLLAIVWSSSYYGRVNVIEHLRGGCQRGARNTAATINVIRGEANANREIAENSTENERSRVTRRGEAELEEREVAGFDSRTVLSALPDVIDVRDRDAIASNGLTCAKLYPIPPLISFH